MAALLLPNEILSMSAQAARRLVEAGDGDGALLYLALLECGGDEAKAAASLRWDGERLGRTLERLAALGLAQSRGDASVLQPPRPEDAPMPEYTRGEVNAALEREPDFKNLYREMERALGRVLTDSDLKSLYTLYDYLGLPPEVILPMTTHVIREERRQRNSAGYVPRMARIQREGFRWKRLGVDTAERAEEFLRREEQVDRREWAILSAVGAKERRPAVGREREFIAKWVEAGYSDELIRLAYERTVYQKGAMNWPYMNRILERWQQAGYRTPEQVKAGDKPPQRQSGRSAGKSPADFQPSRESIRENNDWLDQFLEQQKEKKGG